MAYDCTLIETYPGFGPELTVDGNMEDDPTTNWPGTDAAVVESTANVHAGCLALSVQPTAAPGWASQSVTVEAGHRYRIGVWGLRNAPTDQWRVTIYIAGSVVWTGDWHAEAAWTEEVKFYRIPDGITTIEIRLEVDQINDRAFFDDVSVRREAPVPMTEIDLYYRAADDWSMLNQGISINDPAIKEIWGGELEDKLVHRSEGKRVIPMELNLEAASADSLIDDVNGLEEMLRHAARYRIDGWGGEVFLQFKTDNATHYVWYPVITGRIDKRNLMKKCCSDEVIDSVPATIICEAYWESPFTYDLSNLLDNPGFEEWNAGICDSEPDCWTDHESLAAGTGTNQQETDTVEEGCEALRIEVAGINNADYKGVYQDLGAAAGSGRVSDDVEYTLLAWVQNEAITNGVIQVYAVGSVSGTLGTAISSGAANADYTMYECQFTPSGGDAAGNVYIFARILGTVNGCSGIAHIDKMLVMEGSNVPTGWMSSSYLTNHYDRDPNTVNFFSVCDIPGEVDAECDVMLTMDDTEGEIYVSQRTRNQPCEFIWQLIPCEAHTTAEGGVGGACQPGLTDAACIDSDKIIDASAPSGSRIEISFANQTMQQRCYWDIGLDALARDLISYYGKFAVILLCETSGNTDTIGIKVRGLENGLGPAMPAHIIAQTTTTAPANEWNMVTGWSILEFPIGTHQDNRWDAGNFWRISVYAETDGVPTDTLYIAGAYLVPLDERYLVAGDDLGQAFGSTMDVHIHNLDGDRGVFPHSFTTNRDYSNVGAVGQYPQLVPEIQNWLYFILANIGTQSDVDITDTATAAITYRPRGIFLRGTNP